MWQHWKLLLVAQPHCQEKHLFGLYVFRLLGPSPKTSLLFIIIIYIIIIIIIIITTQSKKTLLPANNGIKPL